MTISNKRQKEADKGERRSYSAISFRFLTVTEPEVQDRCVGESCKCPAGMTGVQPFCTPIEQRKCAVEQKNQCCDCMMRLRERKKASKHASKQASKQASKKERKKEREKSRKKKERKKERIGETVRQTDDECKSASIHSVIVKAVTKKLCLSHQRSQNVLKGFAFLGEI